MAQNESTWMPKGFTRPKTITHPGTNWVWYRVTTVIKTNALGAHR